MSLIFDGMASASCSIPSMGNLNTFPSPCPTHLQGEAVCFDVNDIHQNEVHISSVERYL
jgi:hypothetical protein